MVAGLVMTEAAVEPLAATVGLQLASSAIVLAA